MHKLDKTQALYVPASHLSPASAEPRGASCDRCAFMLARPSTTCGIFNEPVSRERGVCGLYAYGKPVLKEAHALVTKKDAGYVVSPGVPTHCGNCEYYGGDTADGPCKRVAGTVEFYGCCALWEYDTKFSFKKVTSE